MNGAKSDAAEQDASQQKNDIEEDGELPEHMPGPPDASRPLMVRIFRFILFFCHAHSTLNLTSTHLAWSSIPHSYTTLQHQGTVRSS